MQLKNVKKKRCIEMFYSHCTIVYTINKYLPIGWKYSRIWNLFVTWVTIFVLHLLRQELSDFLEVLVFCGYILLVYIAYFNMRKKSKEHLEPCLILDTCWDILLITFNFESLETLAFVGKCYKVICIILEDKLLFHIQSPLQ